MVLLTRISSAKKGTKSLKTTIPEGVVEFLELSDKAEYRMENAGEQLRKISYDQEEDY